MPWSDFVIFTQFGPATYSKTVGAVSPATTGVTRLTSNVKSYGAKSEGFVGLVRQNPQILTPFKILTPGNWTGPNGVAPTVAQIGEISPNDATFLQSGYHPVNDTMRVQLNGGNAPQAGPVVLKIRYQKNQTPGVENIDLTVKLYAGATLITTRTYTNIGAIVEDDYTLTTGEVAAIPNFWDMEVEFTANHQ